MADHLPETVTENEEGLRALADSDLRTSELARAVLGHFDHGVPEKSVSPSVSIEDPSLTTETEPTQGVLEF